MRNAISVFITLLAVTLLTSTALVNAGGIVDPVEYTVDLGGIDPSTNHELRVAGTIDFDLASNTLLGSNLAIIHEGASFPLPSIPVTSQDGGAAWHWSASPNRLGIVLESVFETEPGEVFWSTEINPAPDEITAGFFLDNGQGRHLHYSDTPEFSEGHVDNILLDPNYDPAMSIPEPGLLVGVVVPETSTFALAALGLVAFGCCSRRKRF